MSYWLSRLFGVTLVVALVLGAGCDPNASATSSSRIAGASERLSRLYESCGRSGDCADNLRCLDRVCKRTDSSLVGDYYAAVGAYELGAGNIEKAVDAYNSAVNRYEADKIEVPLEVRCARGQALVAAREGNRELAELAARSLHLCLRDAPVGSAVRAQALANLAVLSRSGLDPELLARDQPVDVYLTKQPAEPSADGVRVEVAGDGRTKAPSYNEFLERLKTEDVRPALVACWEVGWKAARTKVLTVALPFRYRFIQGEFEEDDRDKLSLAGPEPAAGTAERCVYDALVPVAEAFTKGKRGGGRWDGTVTLTIGQP